MTERRESHGATTRIGAPRAAPPPAPVRDPRDRPDADHPRHRHQSPARRTQRDCTARHHQDPRRCLPATDRRPGWHVRHTRSPGRRRGPRLRHLVPHLAPAPGPAPEPVPHPLPPAVLPWGAPGGACTGTARGDGRARESGGARVHGARQGLADRERCGPACTEDGDSGA